MSEKAFSKVAMFNNPKVKKATDDLFAHLEANGSMDKIIDIMRRAKLGELAPAPAPAIPAPADPADPIPADPADPIPADPAPDNPTPNPVAQPAREGKEVHQRNHFAWNLADNFPIQRPAYPENGKHGLAVVQMSSTALEELEKNEWNMRLYDHLPNEDEQFWEGDLYRWVKVDETVRQPKNRKYFLVCFGVDKEYVIFPSITAISRVMGERTTSINWILPI
eukprot:g79892.t1